MMIACPSCNQPTQEEGNNFCAHCGNSIRIRCLMCKQDLAATEELAEVSKWRTPLEGEIATLSETVKHLRIERDELEETRAILAGKIHQKDLEIAALRRQLEEK